jgi:hypothetical protein
LHFGEWKLMADSYQPSAVSYQRVVSIMLCVVHQAPVRSHARFAFAGDNLRN